MTEGPLTGIRVLDFSWVHAGPVCGMILGEMGAEVIKIESSRRHDIIRRLPPMADGERGLNRSGYFNSVNRAKRSCALNFATNEGRTLVLDLARTADVVLENFSVGVMDKLGIGYQALRAVQPDIIMASISGYGATGPDHAYVAYGPPLTAFSGLVQLHGYEGDEPRPVGIAWPDPVAGFTAAFAVLAALHHRADTGEGQWIDISQAETIIALMGDQITETTMNGRQPKRIGNASPGHAPHNVYHCAGHDAWVAIAVTEERHWAGLLAVIDDPALRNDDFADSYRRWEHREQLDPIISRWTAQRTPQEAAGLLQQHGVPATPCNTAADLMADEHLKERVAFGLDVHPEVGPRMMPSLPWRFSDREYTIGAAAPLFGEGSAYVYTQLLGMTPERFTALTESGVTI